MEDGTRIITQKFIREQTRQAVLDWLKSDDKPKHDRYFTEAQKDGKRDRKPLPKAEESQPNKEELMKQLAKIYNSNNTMDSRYRQAKNEIEPAIAKLYKLEYLGLSVLRSSGLKYPIDHFIVRAKQRFTNCKTIVDAIMNPDEVIKKGGECDYKKGTFIICTEGDKFKTVKRQKKHENTIIPDFNEVGVFNGKYIIVRKPN